MVDVAQLKSLILLQMEDECSIGNDETRIFILSSYASNKMNRVPCVLCKNIMYIFDRYPLIDGTFFLSPRQHSNSCIKVGSDQKALINQGLQSSLEDCIPTGQMRGKDQLHDSCLHGLSGGLDWQRNRLQVLPQAVDRRAPHPWNNVFL